MKPEENSTVIGKSVTIRGEITGKDNLFLDGVVEGTILLAEGRLTIGPNARVKADVEAQDIVVQGEVDGNLRARDRVELRSTARVKSNITTSRIAIEENATINGQVHVSETAASNTRATVDSTETNTVTAQV